MKLQNSKAAWDSQWQPCNKDSLWHPLAPAALGLNAKTIIKLMTGLERLIATHFDQGEPDEGWAVCVRMQSYKELYNPYLGD